MGPVKFNRYYRNLKTRAYAYKEYFALSLYREENEDFKHTLYEFSNYHDGLSSNFNCFQKSLRIEQQLSDSFTEPLSEVNMFRIGNHNLLEHIRFIYN